MDLAEIMTATQVLLGEISPGSGSFDDQYMDAIQWAQEEVCRFLGLSYVETFVAWSGVTGATGEVVSTVIIPQDCIKLERVMSSPMRLADGGFAGTTNWAGTMDGRNASTTTWTYHVLAGDAHLYSIISHP